MEDLRKEDQKTLQLLFQKARELEDEQDREADMEDYRYMQALNNAEEQEEEKLKELNKEKEDQIGEDILQIEEKLSKGEQEEQSQIIEELQKQLSADELFTSESEEQSKLKKCIICSIVKPKYCCPGCSKKTCSLVCSKEHKQKYGCNGKANYSGFISKQDYNDKSASRDYQYLKKTLEGTEFIRKKLSFALHNPELLRLKLLKIFAWKKHKIELSFAPSIMSRHRENLSFYYMKNKLIFWHVEVLLVSFQKKQVESKNSQQSEQPLEEKEVQTRKLIDPVGEDQQLKDIIRDEKSTLFDESLLLSYNIDFSIDGLTKQLQNNQLKMFFKNRFRICELIEISQNDIHMPLPFCIPEDYLSIQIPEYYKDREALDKDFQQRYQMIEISMASTLSLSLLYSKINEYPSVYLMNILFKEQFERKYSILYLPEAQK